jgi:hypothetical protein
LYNAMLAAWQATKTVPLTQFEFRSVPLRLEPRDHPGFTVADLKRRLDNPDPKQAMKTAIRAVLKRDAKQ